MQLKTGASEDAPVFLLIENKIQQPSPYHSVNAFGKRGQNE
jgi:hypothetical protein